MIEAETTIVNHSIELANREPHLAVLSPHEYLVDFEKEAAKAKEIIGLKTMVFGPDSIGDITLDIFKNSPPDVQKQLFVDWYSLLTTDNGEIDIFNSHMPFVNKTVKKANQSRDALFEELRRQRVEITFTNPPKHIGERIIPALGRNHMKGARVDNNVFYFGGVNLHGVNFEDLADFMVKFTGTTAATLSAELNKIMLDKIDDDYALPLDTNSTLLVDKGIPGKSIILDTAVQLTQNEKDRAYNTSLFVPDYPMSKALHTATKQGADVEVITASFDFPSPFPITLESAHWAINNMNVAALKTFGYRFPMRFNPYRGIHAKLVIGKDWALFGSNNLSKKGVDAGTGEWAILTYEKQLVASLLRYYKDLRQEGLSELQLLQQ